MIGEEKDGAPREEGTEKSSPNKETLGKGCMGIAR
jgi:hypothetical protein